MLIKILFGAILIAAINCTPIKKDASASCLTCHPTDPEKLNVHLVPHSHDDVGWLKTVDQYFYGDRSNIQRAGVQYIISSTLEALLQNPDRKFVQVETAFFWKWWKDQSETTRDSYRRMVETGQIEMINGAWSMNDEACSNYQSTIDQFTWGLRILKETLGECAAPRIGWQIDPFGHSREQASIFNQLGYDGVFFARIDGKDKEGRKAASNMDLLWKASANNDDSYIFTNVFPDLYFPPSGFCWDVTCDDQVVIDDPSSFDYNVVTRISDFTAKAKQYAEYYRTNNIMFTMGGDFHYQAADMNFINMDKIIKAFENNTEINVIYSTPSCYIQAVNAANPKLKLKTDDFFPYGESDEHSYWSGYFTSRPNSKRFERTSHKILQSAKQIDAFHKIKSGEDKTSDSLTWLREVMGIMQHHDAITGTEKQHVVQDYVRLLTRAVETAEEPIGVVLADLLNAESKDLKLTSCLLSNISICEASQSDAFTVAVYNPISRTVDHHVRLPVPIGTYEVTGIDGVVVNDVFNPLTDFSYVDLKRSVSPRELVFTAKEVPALGLNLYKIVRVSSNDSLVPEDNSTLVFGDDETGFELDGETNTLKMARINGLEFLVNQNFFYYNGANGDNNGVNKASGAYIFRPLNGTTEATVISEKAELLAASRGKLVDEVRLKFDYITEIIRVYKDTTENNIEFDWIVGPIPVDEQNGIGKEIITRFTLPEMINEGVFYTDSNGRELIKRTLNKRPDFEVNYEAEPIASNYYPVTSRIVIKYQTNNVQAAVLNDRSQGGSSLRDGEIELMIHRRLLKDDSKGVDEALNESEFNDGVRVRGKHYLTFGHSKSTNPGVTKSANAVERELALKKLLSPWVLVGPKTSALNLQLKTLAKSISDNVNILTLEPWSDNTYLLRLEHILELNEDSVNQYTSVYLTDLFTNFEITSVRETTLGANQLIADFNSRAQYKWGIQNSTKTVQNGPRHDAITLKIDMSPMQIRTFIITVKRI